MHRYNLLIDARGRAGDADGALSLLSTMRRRTGHAPNAWSYTLALHACARAGDARRALEVIESKQRAGLSHDPLVHMDSYFLLQACAADQQLGWAMNLIAEMRKAGVQPEGWWFTFAIRACGQRWKEAVRLLEAAKRTAADGRPEFATYRAAASVCRHARQMDAVRAIEAEMSKLGMHKVTASLRQNPLTAVTPPPGRIFVP
ncbi:hypothetical protein JKP88DRAFT_199874 [Tribonema minus]|uniref:Uncharacterized protein n=1 Tax=Tribonema minus TaxID=303371 RepID=A0A835YTT7_9STRA|nr:hypothetical protein JKP88DRAFT_199874 [Tribonema minus]